MKLSKMEQLILVNQFSIRKKLEETEAYDECIEILKNGYELFYDDVFLNLSSVPADTCQFVLDVLDMFGAIEIYCRQHPEEAEGEVFKHSHFSGFDAANESDHLSFTRFLIHKQGKFPEQLLTNGTGSTATLPMSSHIDVC